MKRSALSFSTSAELGQLIGEYFKYIEGEYHLENKAGKSADAGMAQLKVWDRQPEPPTITGLAYHLGFNSRRAFDEYEEKGKYSGLLKRSRLRIEMDYERKLHNQSAAGPIFALKSLGWNEKDERTAENEETKYLSVNVIETGPIPVAREKDVVL